MLATVNNVFQNSNATQKSVNTAIVDGIKNSGGFLNGTIFTGACVMQTTCLFQQDIANVLRSPMVNLLNAAFHSLSLCLSSATELCLEQPLPCDSMSTKCKSLNGRAQCSCQEGFIPNVFSSKSCSGKSHKQVAP